MGRFRHPTRSVRTTPERRKPAVNKTQQGEKAPETMLGSSAAFLKKAEARWFERLQEESTVLFKILDHKKDHQAGVLAAEEAGWLAGFKDSLKYSK